MLSIEPLSREQDRVSFDCGVPALNQFLQQNARQAQDRGLSRTFVALAIETPGESKQILGYFSLAATEASTDTLPPTLAKRFPTRIPAIILARLAVDRRYQGQGIGAALLAEALTRIARVSDELGIAGAFVDAKDEAASRFYQHYGFIPLPSDSNRLFLPLAMIRELSS